MSTALAWSFVNRTIASAASSATADAPGGRRRDRDGDGDRDRELERERERDRDRDRDGDLAGLRGPMLGATKMDEGVPDARAFGRAEAGVFDPPLRPAEVLSSDVSAGLDARDGAGTGGTGRLPFDFCDKR
jgi:Ni/Co efflux regulator RcnB